MSENEAWTYCVAIVSTATVFCTFIVCAFNGLKKDK